MKPRVMAGGNSTVENAGPRQFLLLFERSEIYHFQAYSVVIYEYRYRYPDKNDLDASYTIFLPGRVYSTL